MATTLSLQTFNSLMQNTAAAVQGACSSLLNLNPGSVLNSILEASNSTALWLQWLLVQLMARQRLATSTGIDVDSFVNDYGMYRLPAVAASGYVTFSRYTATNAATVPVGAIVISGDGTQQFSVVANTANGFWNGTGYTIPAGTLSAALPVQAVTAGTGGNENAGAINLIGTAIVGVDYVSNAAATTGGVNAETDAACIARFQVYINSLARATPAAVMAAVAGTQQGLTYYLAENVNTAGTYTPGNFVITVDNGTGSPPTTLLNSIYANVNLVRPVGSTFQVQGPTVTSVPIVLTLTVATGIVKANVTSTVQSAIQAYVNTLAVGATLPYSAIANTAWNSLPAGEITNVSAITVNGGTADIVPGTSGVVKASTVTVN